MNVAQDHFGYTSDHTMRSRLADAAIQYREDECHRAPLNAFIMSIQEPYLEIIAKLQAQLRQANQTVQDVHSEAKERKRREHDKARNARMEAKRVQK